MILLSEDVPLHSPLLYVTLPEFEKGPGPQFGEVSVVGDSASLEGEAASFIAVAHTFECMRAARHAMMDLSAGATSRQISIMARAQLLLALHCLIPPW